MTYAGQFKSGFWLAFDSLKMIWRHKKLLALGVGASMRFLFAIISFLAAVHHTNSLFGSLLFVLIGVVCLCAGIFLEAAIVQLSAAILDKRKITIREIVQQDSAQLRPLLLWVTISFAGMLIPLATVAWPIVMFFVLPLIVLGKCNVWKAIEQSFALMEAQWARIAGVFVAEGVVVALPFMLIFLTGYSYGIFILFWFTVWGFMITLTDVVATRMYHNSRHDQDDFFEVEAFEHIEM